ncbi:hypothetical protein H696_02952 [Fonticula alba]|uniref:Nucleoporin Nup133/Nup155-like N-terminal domain-containing protein n=1 Tax=Fonticula alba TaxID=691883 RepID=A0A058Z8H3_FONAL|nr:hypothetical protein H696_02952 [Fonticula alba]KCV70594.1 hypothetical protein H696_02952 [Fonticula alba]|eukprot:XP_009495110.1 hypothetical protein H696_02952 [Fonticula alba]
MPQDLHATAEGAAHFHALRHASDLINRTIAEDSCATEICDISLKCAWATGRTCLPLCGFEASTDGVHMVDIVGTKNGRVFLAGRDGHLHELVYQPEGWLRNRCYLINWTRGPLAPFIPAFLKLHREDQLVSVTVDDASQTLYTLSESSVINAYRLSGAGPATHSALGAMLAADQGLSLAVSCSHLVKAALQQAPADLLLDASMMRVVSLKPIKASESSRVRLVAVTAIGARVYLDQNLSILSVRMPPRETAATGGFGLGGPALAANAAASGPARVHTVCLHNGVTLMASTQSDDVDMLTMFAPDQRGSGPRAAGGAGTSAYVEQLARLPVSGKIWALDESPAATSDFGAIPDSAISELVSQYYQAPREFLCLTSAGIHELVKLRPIDLLRRLLIASGLNITGALLQFFKSFTRDEACCMCLALICSETPSGSNETLVAAARQALFHFGSTQQFTAQEVVQQPAGLEFGRLVVTPEAAFSGVHNAVVMYASRLVRSLWRVPLASLASSNTDLTAESGPIRLSQLSARLGTLLQFIRTIRVPDAPSESQSLAAVQAFLGETLQAIDFLLFLIDNYSYLTSADVMKELVGSTQTVGFESGGLGITLEALMTTGSGRQVGRLLMSAILRTQIEAGASVDALLLTLRDRAPAFFDADDATLHRADGLLRRARDAPTLQERLRLLAEATAHFTSVAATLSVATLTRISSELCQQHAHMAALALALRCAALVPVGPELAAALLAASAGNPAGGAPVTASASATSSSMAGGVSSALIGPGASEQVPPARMGFYRLAFSVLRDAQLLFQQKQEANTGASAAGGSALSGSTSAAAVGALLEETFAAAFASADPIFHALLYSELLHSRSPGDLARLLDARTPFVEGFLRAAVELDLSQGLPEDALTTMSRALAFAPAGGPAPGGPAGADIDQSRHRNLLWRYHIRHGQFLVAAHELYRLASTDSDPTLDLDSRIAYLSRAAACVRSKTSAPSAGDLIQQLDDALEVANAQRQLLLEVWRLASSPEGVSSSGARPGASAAAGAARGHNPDLVLASLDRLSGLSGLLTLEEMFNEIAVPLKLYEMVLILLKLSGTSSPSMVDQTWTYLLLLHRGTPLPALAERLVVLGRQLFPSDRVLPVPLLVAKLERFLLERPDAAASSVAAFSMEPSPLVPAGLPRTWPVEVLLRVGVPSSALFAAYYHLLVETTTASQWAAALSGATSGTKTAGGAPASASTGGIPAPVNVAPASTAPALHGLSPTELHTRALLQLAASLLHVVDHWRQPRLAALAAGADPAAGAGAGLPADGRVAAAELPFNVARADQALVAVLTQLSRFTATPRPENALIEQAQGLVTSLRQFQAQILVGTAPGANRGRASTRD